MSIRDSIERAMDALKFAIEYELPEALERQNRELYERAEKLQRENANLRILVEDMKLEIARLGLELGKALKDGEN
jgi:hypothetical protein